MLHGDRGISSKVILMVLLAGALALIALALTATSARAQTDPPSTGDWVVADQTTVQSRGVLLEGSLIVTGSGRLTLTDVDLRLNCSYPGELNITVDAGGELVLRDFDHDASTKDDATTVASTRGVFHYLWHCYAGSRLTISCSDVRDCGIPQPYVRGLIIDTSDALIENSTFEENNYGLYFRSCSPRVENTTIAHNEGYGAYVFQGAPVFSWCNFTDNFDIGAWLVTTDARFLNCTFADHPWAGMNCTGSIIDVEDSTFRNNTEYGLRCYTDCGGLIARCDVSGGMTAGIYMDAGCSVRVDNCTVHDVPGRGIWIYRSRPTIEHVLVTGCNEALFLYGSPLRASNCTFESSLFDGVMASDSAGFVLVECTVAGNGNNGVFVGTLYTGASSGTVANCTISGNKRAGVYVYDGSSCQIADPVFSSNGIYAIYCDRTGRAEWTVNTTRTVANESVRIAGNITVMAAGRLTLVNTTLVFNSTADASYGIHVLGGNLTLLDGDGDRLTMQDATSIESLEPPYGARPVVAVAVEGGGILIARNCYLISTLVSVRESSLNMSGCEVMEAGSGVASWRAAGELDIRDSTFSKTGEAINASGSGVTLVVEGCAFSQCTCAVRLEGCEGRVTNCTIVSCHIGIQSDRPVTVDTVRFLFCAESIVATAGRIEVLECQVKQSSTYGLRLEDADAVLRGTVIDSTGTKGLVANRSTVEIDGCQFTNDPVSAIVSYDSYLHIVRTTMTATGDTALWVSGGQARLDDSYIGGPVKVVILARAGSAVEAYNTTLPPGTLMAMDTSTIDVWWQFRVRVTVQGGSPPPPPVAVLVRDLTGAEAFNGTAGADGSTPWTWGEQYHVTSDSLGARTPHAVTVVVMGSRFVSSFQLKSRVDHLVVIPRTLVPRISYAGPVDEGAEVTFDGSGSAGVPFPIVGWEWDFAHSGDFVVKATGRTARWTFAKDGLYEVALRVTDSKGNNNTTVVDVAVRDTAPTAQILGEPPSVVDEDQAVTLEGRYVSPVDPIVLQEWDFGDGRTAQGPTATHSWTERGNYTVRYSVLDSDGSTAIATVRIEVRNVPPVAVAPPGPISAQKGKGVFLDGSRSHDTPSDNGSLYYVWDLGNGGRLLGAQVDYAYEHGGNYTVTLRVTDDDGASSTATVLVRVKDEPPRIAPISDVPLKDTDPAYTLVLGPFLKDPDDALKNLTVTVSVAGTELIRADSRLDPALGWVLTITPRRGEQGTAHLTITVADPDGALAGGPFNVTVTREGGVLKRLEQGWAPIAVVLAIVAGVAVAVVIARARRKGKDEL